jgi:maltooligosyltrehalose trehalohydrolase
MGSRHAFELTWGAEVLAGGGARFRLWAPALDRSSLLAVPSGKTQEMQPSGDGWMELTTDLVAAGDCYLFQLPNGMRVPDPAARCQRRDVHGPSRLIDPRTFEWTCTEWRGRPWEEAVVYELHPGTFTPDGTFAGIESKLDELAALGITLVELMPVGQFGGTRGWGYDGVLMYAPHVAYGGPEPLKHLIDAAHQRGLMVFLDVIYNHFGPDGNYLHSYAPEFFNPERHTPWGVAIAYDRAPVRKYFIENALYWLEEYRFDGLRLDAIDQIQGDGDPSLVAEIAATVRGRITDRHVHITTEDDRNITSLHARDDGAITRCTGEWNDDFHHAAHVIATGESDGYYEDYVETPIAKMARCLAEGYIYQGEPSPFRHGGVRGEPSSELPPTAFVDCIQNHDQIGNRAFGERLSMLAAPDAVEALTAVLLLSAHIPMLFMGEEWAETHPFCFFTDFHGELGRQVREGRRNEFKRWRAFADPKNREQIPDPNAISTFEASRLDWSETGQPPHRERLAYVTQLLQLRKESIVPLLAGIGGNAGRVLAADDAGFGVAWTHADGRRLQMFAALTDAAWTVPPAVRDAVSQPGALIFETKTGCAAGIAGGTIPPWSVVVRVGGR